jgi:hypothetical protein
MPTKHTRRARKPLAERKRIPRDAIAATCPKCGPTHIAGVGMGLVILGCGCRWTAVYRSETGATWERD